MAKLRLVLYFPPWGFSEGQEIDVKFTNRKRYSKDCDPPLLSLTHGEGTALQFVLEDVDASMKFHRAIYNGKFLKDAQNWEAGHFEMRYIPKGKRMVLIDE